MLALLFFTGCAWADDSPRVVFLSPTTDVEHPFWKNYILFMAAAADDLGVDLEVIPAKDRYAMVDAAWHVMTGGNKPDYLIAVYLKGAGAQILDVAAENGVPVFLVNTEIQPEDMNVIGYPRKQYPNWLGDMCYDDAGGGMALASALVRAARQRAWKGCDECIHVVGLTGSNDNSASMGRERGLKQAIAHEADVKLERMLSGYWKGDIAAKKTAHMLELNRDIRIIWAASDAMALGAADAAEQTGRVAGEDVYIGGFDWSQEGLDAIENKRLVASAGGHFMEGAWALVLLHDYHKGMDFARFGLEYRLPMQLLEATNIDLGRELLAPEQWKKIDFKCFSRVYNGGGEYDFSLEAVLGCLRECR